MFDALERDACRSRRPRIEMEIEMATATALKHAPKQLPPPNADFFQFAETLGNEERVIVKKVRAYMETKVAPIINKHWVEDSFPFELLPSYKELGIAGIGMNGYPSVPCGRQNWAW